MLLIRPKPCLGESMIGYLHRLAEDNGYPSVNLMRRLIRSENRTLERNLLTPESISLLAKYSGYSEYELFMLTSNDHRNLIHEHQYNQLFLRQRVQYCPSCIQETLIHQKLWCLSAIRICHIHHTWLVSECVCGQKIDLQSVIKGFCQHCNSSLQSAFSSEPDKQITNLQAQLHRLFVSSSGRINILDREIGIVQFLSLVKHSLNLLHDTPSFIYQGVNIKDLTSRGKHFQECCLSYFEVIEMYQEFPKRFTRVLEEQKFKLSSSQTTAKYNFEKLFIDPTWDPIKQVYSSFLNDTKSRRSGSTPPTTLNIFRHKTLSKTATSHYLGVGIDTVKMLIQLGVLTEKEISFEKKIALSELIFLFERCMGQRTTCTGRISLRDIIQMYPKKCLNVSGLIFLVLEGVLQTASDNHCSSLMNITFDRTEIDFCFNAVFLSQVLKGEGKMNDTKLNEFRMGLASVTGQGIILNGNVYTNARMVKHQWFEAAVKNGEWEIPVLYMPEVPNFLLLYDPDGMEVASAIEDREELDKEIIDTYHAAINELKRRLLKRKDNKAQN